MGSNGGISANGQLSRRFERATRLEGLPECHLKCPRLFSRPVRITDVSMAGARLDVSDGRLSAVPEGEFAATLVFGGFFECRATLRMVHLSVKGVEKTAGVAFVDPSARLQRLIQDFFKLELLGANLRAEDAPEAGLLRFSDGRGSWLELALAQGAVTRLRGEFPALGQAVAWEGAPSQAAPIERQRQLLRLIRNIPELRPSLKEELEAAVVPLVKVETS